MATDAYDAAKVQALKQIASILQLILNELRSLNRKQ